MRGQIDPQSAMFTYFSPESRVPADHPLRRIKAHADTVLRSMNAEFERLYASTGRPSIPPETLLNASRLSAVAHRRSIFGQLPMLFAAYTLGRSSRRR